MGNRRREMEAYQQAQARRARVGLIIAAVIVTVVLIAGTIVSIVRRPPGASPTTVAAAPRDLFAGLAELSGAADRAGWTARVPTSQGTNRWLTLTNQQLAAALEQKMTSEERLGRNAKLHLRSIDWASRLQLPTPVRARIGERRAVIVGQIHVINGRVPGTVDLQPDVVSCQQEIYRFLLHQRRERTDLTILHEGVTPAHPIRAVDGQKGLAPYVAGVQFALRHAEVEQLPAEDDDVMDLGDALGNYADPDAAIDRWSDCQQITSIEMRSRYMARMMAEVLNRGRTPILVVGDTHEAGVAMALTHAGYKVAVWQPTAVRNAQ